MLGSTVEDVASVSVENGVGILTVDSPPVNALGVAVRRAIWDGLHRLNADPSVKVIVLICEGRTFFAGADIAEFGRPAEPPELRELFDLIERNPVPIVTAIHGTALGGGLETALVSHYRIAVPSARLGLPEVHLGLLPGAGGTQRLPRLVGVETALDLMVSGRQIGAEHAVQLGILDALAEEGCLRRDAIRFAAELVATNRPLARVRDRNEKIDAALEMPEVFDAFRRDNARAFRGFKAPENIVKAVEAAVTLPFDEGMKRELALFSELEASTESLAQRHVFFAERQTAKIPDISKEAPTRTIARVGVVGAGTMGGGIAMNFLNTGLPVTLVETSQAALDRGLKVIRHNYEVAERKGKLTREQVDMRMELITPVIGLDRLDAADLVIEAVYEEMSVKKQIFGKLDDIVRDDTILASNTSFLDLDEIAAATVRPERVVGLHFFSPANVMRLLEIVRGRHTAKDVIATSMQLARRIGKVPVLSGVCPGFIANRIMAQRSHQANALILEGISAQHVDRLLVDYGFAMGEFQMMDLVGLDVIGRGSAERTVGGDLVKLGRLGQKQNGGYYDYDERRRPTPSPVATSVIAEVAKSRGVDPNIDQADEDILFRLLLPVVNEGAKLLEEGVAIRASDIDMAAILGYNWPVYTGGPMFWADTVGIPRVVAKLNDFSKAYGLGFAPSARLVDMAAMGRSFSR